MNGDRSGKRYERLVGNALVDLFQSGEEKAGCSVAWNVVMRGASGVGHEIDLLLASRRTGRTLLMAVECKNWTRPAEKKTVEEFRSVLQDINARYAGRKKLAGILASRSGFQSGACHTSRSASSIRSRVHVSLRAAHSAAAKLG